MQFPPENTPLPSANMNFPSTSSPNSPRLGNKPSHTDSSSTVYPNRYGSAWHPQQFGYRPSTAVIINTFLNQ